LAALSEGGAGEPGEGEVPQAERRPSRKPRKERQWEFERILDRRVANGKAEYLIKWKPWRDEDFEPSWQKESDLREWGKAMETYEQEVALNPSA
jgi:hypothetical protein